MKLSIQRYSREVWPAYISRNPEAGSKSSKQPPCQNLIKCEYIIQSHKINEFWPPSYKKKIKEFLLDAIYFIFLNKKKVTYT